MRAIDTNILVRLVVKDDPEQARRADNLLEEPMLVLSTVVLEAVWVLSSNYRLPRSEITARLKQVLGGPFVESESDELLWALERFETGADFGGMLHLALADASEASSLATFDRKLSRHAAERSSFVESL